MIFASLLLLAQVAPDATGALPPPTPPVAKEIVVIANKLETWKGGLFKRDGKLTCRTKDSTGDPEIDAIRCGAMLRCFGPAAPEFDRIAASVAPEADRNRKMQALAQKLQPCLVAAHEAGTRFLAESRAARK